MSVQAEGLDDHGAPRPAVIDPESPLPFAALYFWDVEETRKGEFKMAWNIAMLAMRKQSGAAASLLATASDGTLIATILWPEGQARAAALVDGGTLSDLPGRSMREECFLLPPSVKQLSR